MGLQVVGTSISRPQIDPGNKMAQRIVSAFFDHDIAFTRYDQLVCRQILQDMRLCERGDFAGSLYSIRVVVREMQIPRSELTLDRPWYPFVVRYSHKHQQFRNWFNRCGLLGLAEHPLVRLSSAEELRKWIQENPTCFLTDVEQVMNELPERRGVIWQALLIDRPNKAFVHLMNQLADVAIQLGKEGFLDILCDFCPELQSLSELRHHYTNHPLRVLKEELISWIMLYPESFICAYKEIESRFPERAPAIWQELWMNRRHPVFVAPLILKIAREIGGQEVRMTIIEFFPELASVEEREEQIKSLTGHGRSCERRRNPLYVLEGDELLEWAVSYPEICFELIYFALRSDRLLRFKLISLLRKKGEDEMYGKPAIQFLMTEAERQEKFWILDDLRRVTGLS